MVSFFFPSRLPLFLLLLSFSFLRHGGGTRGKGRRQDRHQSMKAFIAGLSSFCFGIVLFLGGVVGGLRIFHPFLSARIGALDHIHPPRISLRFRWFVFFFWEEAMFVGVGRCAGRLGNGGGKNGCKYSAPPLRQRHLALVQWPSFLLLLFHSEKGWWWWCRRTVPSTTRPPAFQHLHHTRLCLSFDGHGGAALPHRQFRVFYRHHKIRHIPSRSVREVLPFFRSDVHQHLRRRQDNILVFFFFCGGGVFISLVLWSHLLCVVGALQ